MKSKLVKFNSREDEQQQQGQPLGCAAYGCGQAGTISAGTDGTAKYYCRFHFGLKPHKNDQTTLRVHQNDKLRILFDMCVTPEAFFKPEGDETFFAVADRVIKDELDDMGLSELHVSKNLLKTRRNIITELDNRVFIKEAGTVPLPKDVDVGNYFLDKIMGRG